jgi:hypothetical protein
VDENCFPGSDTLTQRLKRCVDRILKDTQALRGAEGEAAEVADAAAASPGAKAAPRRSGKVKSWQCKKKRPEVVRWLMAFGEPQTEENVRRISRALGEEAVSESLRGAIAEILALVSQPDSPSKAARGKAKRVSTKDYDILPPSTVASLRGRRRQFELLRAVIAAASPSPAESLTLQGARSQLEALPSYWQAGAFDHQLVLGVLRHGWGQWDEIFADDSLPFRRAAAGSGAPTARVLNRRRVLVCAAAAAAGGGAGGAGEGAEGDEEVAEGAEGGEEVAAGGRRGGAETSEGED